MTLRAALTTARKLAQRAEVRPLDTWRPLPGQLDVLTSQVRFRLFRGGNQAIGKTTAGAVDLICHATGVNPYNAEAVTPFPIQAWVVCVSWSQSVTIQQKIWELIPKDLLHPETVYTETWGFAPSKSPIIRIKHIPSGKWSTVRVKTTNQGGLNLAGATIQYAWFDEPPKSQRVFTEVQKRVMKSGRYGRLLLTMTPINAPVEWIKKMAAAGRIEDHHVRLEPAQMIPVGATRPIVLKDGRPCDAGWIEEVIYNTPPHEVPVICHGAWNMVADSPRFPAFKTSGPESHVCAAGDVPAELDLYLGMDHGHQDHSEVCVLIGIQKGQPFPRMWVLDEYVSVEGTTSMDDDAEGVRAMLERWELRWHPDHITAANGDRAHRWGGKGRKAALQRKSNEDFTAAWARVVGEVPDPPLQLVKRGKANLQGAVDYGVRWLHQLMLRPGHFNIVEDCERGILSMQRYQGKPNSEWSHWIDGLRYALRHQIYDVEEDPDGTPVLRLW